MTIGIFDSGIGGLTVLRAVQDRLPHVPVTFLADFGYVPYGPRTADDILERSRRIISWMHHQGVSLVVAACHSSSAVLNSSVLAQAPCPVLTMIDPTVSCIVRQAQQEQWSQGIGLLGTNLTIQQGTLAHALRNTGFSLNIHSLACPGLAEMIESLTWDEAYAYVHHHICPPFQANNIDMLVYGCTHYPLLHPWIADQHFPWWGSVLDPAQEVSHWVASSGHWSAPPCDSSDHNTPSPVSFYYTGPPEQGHVRLARHWPLTHSHVTDLSIDCAAHKA